MKAIEEENPDLKIDEIITQLALWIGCTKEAQIEWFRNAIDKAGKIHSNNGKIMWRYIDRNDKHNKDLFRRKVAECRTRVGYCNEAMEPLQIISEIAKQFCANVSIEDPNVQKTTGQPISEKSGIEYSSIPLKKKEESHKREIVELETIKKQAEQTENPEELKKLLDKVRKYSSKEHPLLVDDIRKLIQSKLDKQKQKENTPTILQDLINGNIDIAKAKKKLKIEAEAQSAKFQKSCRIPGAQINPQSYEKTLLWNMLMDLEKNPEDYHLRDKKEVEIVQLLRALGLNILLITGILIKALAKLGEDQRAENLISNYAEKHKYETGTSTILKMWRNDLMKIQNSRASNSPTQQDPEEVKLK